MSEFEFANSPTLRWFGHLVPGDGLVPATDTRIFWNEDARVHRVAVILLPRRIADLPPSDRHPIWRPMRQIADSFDCSSGNAWRHWMNNDPALLRKLAIVDPNFTHQNPDNLWRYLCCVGFADDGRALHARTEFARIRECVWARDPAIPTPPGTPLTPEDWTWGYCELSGRTFEATELTDFDEAALPLGGPAVDECRADAEFDL